MEGDERQSSGSHAFMGGGGGVLLQVRAWWTRARTVLEQGDSPLLR